MDENQSAPADEKTRGVRRRVFLDPTPDAIIQKRLLGFFMPLLIQRSDASEAERAEYQNLILLQSLKLVAVWQHKSRYDTTEDALIQTARLEPIDMEGTGVVNIATAQELYLELDGFLVQLKSSLDYVVRFLVFGLGIKPSNLLRFGNKGITVINTLKGNTPRRFMAAAEWVIELIEQAQPWLSTAIDARDRMNHGLRGGVSLTEFTVFSKRTGDRVEIVRPMVLPDYSIAEMLNTLWQNLFLLVENIIGISFVSRLPGLALQHRTTEGLDGPKPGWYVISREQAEEIQRMQSGPPTAGT